LKTLVFCEGGFTFNSVSIRFIHSPSKTIKGKDNAASLESHCEKLPHDGHVLVKEKIIKSKNKVSGKTKTKSSNFFNLFIFTRHL